MKNFSKFALTAIVGFIAIVGFLFGLFLGFSFIGIIGEMIFGINPVKESIDANMKPFFAGTWYMTIFAVIAVFLYLSYNVGKLFVKDKED